MQWQVLLNQIWDGVAMRYLISISFAFVAIVLFWATSAWALSERLKDPALARTGVLTTTPCADACNRCDDCCQVATVTMVKVDNRKCPSKTYWLTSAHALTAEDGNYWIDGHKATVSEKGCKSDMAAICKGAAKYGCNWALLVTYDYTPCGATPPVFNFDGPCCGQELFYVNIGKCRDVRKMHVTGIDDTMVFTTNTRPDCWNCGAAVYNHCGEIVGIVVNGGKECGDTWTEIVQAHEGMLPEPN
jgi:hypothetical protein